MAACHTENTSCYLSGSAPRRHSLEHTLMSVVSEKGAYWSPLTSLVALCLLHVRLTHFCFLVRSMEEMERPLTQALEGWVLQQAVSGLMQQGQLEQAEALCTQVEYKCSLFITHI